MILQDLKLFPVVCLIGPRQCGKSTLVKELLKHLNIEYIFLDLERDSDLAKLTYAEDYLNLNLNTLVCIDEVQRKPDLFPLLRYCVDANRKPARYLLLGSASSKLVNQSSESLAGRICYQELTPFLLPEIIEEGLLNKNEQTKTLWERGGFPNSFLAGLTSQSYRWREEFVKTILERDIPLLDVRIPALTLKRMFSMMAHSHGQIANLSKLGDSLGLSHTSIRQYIDLFENIFMIRSLPPFESNLKKRLVKSPKIYIRDSGVLHTLLKLDSLSEVLAHPVCGASWEGFVIEQIISCLNSRWTYGFYRTQTGVELDLVLEKGGVCIAVECKLSQTPSLSKGFWQACRDLNIRKAYIIAPVTESFPAGAQGECVVKVMPLWGFLGEIKLDVV
ncbi:MAG: ATP-binding protein [Bdellovibrionota bacterium]